MATPELIAAGLAAERNKTLIAIRSPVLSASLRIDGGPKRDLPRFVELGAGAHVLVVTAPDHLRKKRRVVLERGAVRALDIALEPEPAELALSTSVGAEVHIDGEFVGVAPFDDNIAVEPGTRRIRVTLTGHHVAEREIVVTRGVVTEVTIELAATHQRIAAGLLIGAGALAVTGAIVLGIGSTIHDQDAGDASDESDSAELGRQAEEWRILSGITAATGFGFFLAGGTLFIFDEPDVRLEARGSSLWLRGRF